MAHSRAARKYVDRLAELPFVEMIHLRAYQGKTGDLWDYMLELRVGGRSRRLFVEEKRTEDLTHSLIEDLAARSTRLDRADWILFAPYVSGPAGERLRARNVNYVDLAGNCNVAFDRSHVALVVGKKRPSVEREAVGIGSAGYRVIFALLVRPALLQSTVREVAKHSNTSKSGVSLILRGLERDQVIGKTRTRKVLARPRALIDRWLLGYETVLRPRLVYGKYTSRGVSPTSLDEALVDQASREVGDGLWRDSEGIPIRWARGGTAAAYLLTGHYRGVETVLHFAREPVVPTRELSLRPSATGEVTFLGVPAPLAFAGPDSKTVDPLLVYSELVLSKEERAMEAAQEIHERYLAYLS